MRRWTSASSPSSMRSSAPASASGMRRPASTGSGLQACDGRRRRGRVRVDGSPHESSCTPTCRSASPAAHGLSGGQIGGSLVGGSMARSDRARSDLLVGDHCRAERGTGDVWDTRLGFVSPLPVVTAGRYMATVTFTVIGDESRGGPRPCCCRGSSHLYGGHSATARSPHGGGGPTSALRFGRLVIRVERGREPRRGRRRAYRLLLDRGRPRVVAAVAATRRGRELTVGPRRFLSRRRRQPGSPVSSRSPRRGARRPRRARASHRSPAARAGGGRPDQESALSWSYAPPAGSCPAPFPARASCEAWARARIFQLSVVNHGSVTETLERGGVYRSRCVAARRTRGSDRSRARAANGAQRGAVRLRGGLSGWVTARGMAAQPGRPGARRTFRVRAGQEADAFGSF